MSKLVAASFVALDGVMESPDEWHFAYANDELMQDQSVTMARTGALLLGRRTYQEFAQVWPARTGPEFGPFADFMNNTPKLVVSTTLTSTDDWQNSSLITGDVIQELSRLKRQPGKDLTVIGSATLVKSLLQAGLLDELHLLLDPVIVGSGRSLLSELGRKVPLKLTESRVFSTGVLSLTYAPVAQDTNP